MIRPIGNRVVIRQVKIETSKSGIIIGHDEDGNKGEKLPIGEIVAIGKGVGITESEVIVGDKVHFNEFAGERVKVDNEELLILSINDIIAKC